MDAKNKAMKTCAACGADIAKSAKTCPSCGAKNKKPIFKRVWFWILIAIFALIVIAAMGNDTPDTDTSGSQSNIEEQSDATSGGDLNDNPDINASGDPSNDDSTNQIPTKEELNTYNEILAALNADFDTPEEEILQKLSPQMGMSVDEMKEFINWVMPYATGLIPISDEPSFIELVSYAQTALKNITNEDVKISTKESDWKIGLTGLRCILESDTVKIGNTSHNVIIKMEFTDAYFDEYVVFQLKIDGKNIDL